MAIRYLKLTTDADVIADVQENRNMLVTTIKNPIRVVLTPQGAALVPFCPFSKDKEFEIKTDLIMINSEPDDDLLNAYNAKFGGVIVANAPLLINPED